jgi:membrane fusion protein, multidrug efflux system
MSDTTQTVPKTTAPAPAPSRTAAWAFPFLRVLLVVAVAALAWYIAASWDRWTGGARFERTADAYMTGDVTPLAAKISGYVSAVPVNDYQQVRKGDLLVEIEPSDYRAQLEQAEANLAAAQAALANLANQRDVQQALIRQAEATIQATAADLLRYTLEERRQQTLLNTRIAGTEQAVEQAQANERRTAAQLQLNNAQLDQQKALLAGRSRATISAIPASSRPRTASWASARCAPASSSTRARS